MSIFWHELTTYSHTLQHPYLIGLLVLVFLVVVSAVAVIALVVVLAIIRVIADDVILFFKNITK